jgi:hypothetical protein
MLYPELQRKIRIVRTKFGFSADAVRQELKPLKVKTERGTDPDRGTVGRWLNSPENLKETTQIKLVKAIIGAIKKRNVRMSESVFRRNNFLDFCAAIGVSTFDAIKILGINLPVPDIIINSVFEPTDDHANRYVGHWLLFRHDKDNDRADAPYIQAYATFKENEHSQLVYRDEWGSGPSQESYRGFVFFVGSKINIIGESSSTGAMARPEIFWIGLDARLDGGRALRLYGYVSDLNRRGALFADRIVLARVNEKEWMEARQRHKHYLSLEEVRAVVGRALGRYLGEWETLPIDPPSLESE